MFEHEIEAVLMRFTSLRHLIADQCGMKRIDLEVGEWIAIGKSCTLAGLKRAKDRVIYLIIQFAFHNVFTVHLQSTPAAP